MISRILTMIPVRENSEAVIKFTQVYVLIHIDTGGSHVTFDSHELSAVGFGRVLRHGPRIKEPPRGAEEMKNQGDDPLVMTNISMV